LTHVLETTPTWSVAGDCTYNLFRNNGKPDLLCAVREDYHVPGFIDPAHWSFERVLRPADPRPPGFDDKAARTGMRFCGFYLFQVTDVYGKRAA
jgi:hypothetical protein